MLEGKIMSAKSITFPDPPHDKYIFRFNGRAWIWYETPGLWKSYGSNEGDADHIDVVKWSQVYEKPEQIDLLGDKNEINGGSYLGVK